MKPPKEVIRLIRESNITTGPEVDERILRDVRKEMAKRRQNRSSLRDTVLWRTLMKSKTTIFGTASMTAIVALIVFHFIGNTLRPDLTFAQVIEPILKAKTAAWDTVFGSDDSIKLQTRVMVMGSRVRKRTGRAVTIVDLENGRRLLLDEENMEARYMVQKINIPKGMPSGQNFLEELKNTILRLKDMPDYTVEELGRKKLDGHEVLGFYASHPDIDITIWADINTRLPVHIEYNIGTLHQTCRNMEFDLPLDEEMFSTEVPPGYTVREPVTLDQRPTEENFIKGLRLIAEKLNYGRFPDDVSYESIYKWITSDPVFASRLGAMSKEEAEASLWELAEYSYFTVFFPGEGEWTYRGKDVRLGEAETPIFWYRPKESETYRVIYGDLHVENIAADSLPK